MTPPRQPPRAPALPAALAPLAAAVGGVPGRELAGYDEPFLWQVVQQRLAATASPHLAGYVARVAGDPTEAQALCQALNVSYSEFFRDPLAFAVLEQRVLPALLEARPPLARPEIRVWSAGCAAGQEAYSVAILLAELAGGDPAARPFRVIATDHAEAALATARTGSYDATALRHVRLGHWQRYFVPNGTAQVIVPELQAQVDFSAYDLLDEQSAAPPAGIFGDFDLILCCNVLLYYGLEGRRRILAKLRRALAPGGCLMVGEAERGLVDATGGFRALAAPAAVFKAGPVGVRPPVPQ